MIAFNTTDERQAALSAAESAYRLWADRHSIDADEATDAQLAELDRLQAEAEQRAVTALRSTVPPNR